MIDPSRLIDLHGSESDRNRGTNVKYYVVEDHHRLHKSVHELDWNLILD